MYDRSFIVLACVITIVNYDPKTFIVQATDLAYDRSIVRSFIVLATVIIIIYYDLKLL